MFFFLGCKVQFMYLLTVLIVYELKWVLFSFQFLFFQKPGCRFPFPRFQIRSQCRFYVVGSRFVLSVDSMMKTLVSRFQLPVSYADGSSFQVLASCFQVECSCFQVLYLILKILKILGCNVQVLGSCSYQLLCGMHVGALVVCF